MRSSLIFLVSVLLAASGCSQSPESKLRVPAAASAEAAPKPPQRISDRALGKDEGRVRLNPSGGYYSSVDVAARETHNYALVIDRLNLHEKWAPLQSVCAEGEQKQRRACLTMQAQGQEPRSIAIRISVRVNSEGADEEQLTHVKGNFFPGKEIRVKAKVTPTTVEFKVNGMTVMSKPIRFKADSINLGCSSAECSFTML